MADIEAQAVVQPLKTGNKGQTLHTVAIQIAQGGYNRGQLVQLDGVIWVSLLDHNMSRPGDRGWTLHS